ncbi:signal recognition particle subunit [Curvularia kusanoi]|jgi:signal recognition particle subunit SRP19|uniref:Signal recognition particle subunit n=1 Tax=Curvularia kusanoi TaxID=90978 RepID=A0A9P4T8H8_CURKU|nr:signal recognition particle subunit [Curvularia kusanoi]
MNPRIEEVSESDSDPSEMDIDDMNELLQARKVDELISARNIPASSQDRQEMLQPQGPNVKTSTDREKSKHYQCLYPVYFDKSRTRAEGRRVGQDLAVENPLAREMADAAADLGLSTVFEPDKTHPKDWANPGRVRVLLKGKDGKLTDPDINNKHHLYIKIAQYLKQHPTQRNTPFRLPIAGMPMPKEMPEPAVPKGWKLNKILPLHSPAITGGGVSENFLQDMMAEMQGQLPGAESGASSGAEGKKKKDKKKK